MSPKLSLLSAAALSAFPSAKIIWCHVTRSLVNSDLKCMWKEAVAVKCEIVYIHFLEELMERTKQITVCG